MISILTSLTWQLKAPIHKRENINLSSVGYAWLQELSEMRGRVLFDGGRRPGFQLADGTFADLDPLDTHAYHLLVRSSVSLVGCTRVAPLINAPTCITESFLGCEEFTRLLLTLGSTRAETAEGSRWMVVPDYRGNRMGLSLVAGGIAICRCLGMKTVIVMAGTRDGQDRLLMHLGFHPVPGIALHNAPMFDDHIRLLYLDLSEKPKPLITVLLDKMTNLIECQFSDRLISC
ncbi:MAG TPA: GNAT family N-acyltransferase [Stenomitos sp.]